MASMHDMHSDQSLVTQQIKNGFYGTLYLLANKAYDHSWWILFNLTVEFLMMLSFPMELIAQVTERNDSAAMTLHKSFLAWIAITDSAIWNFNFSLLTFAYSVGFSLAAIVVGFSVHAGYLLRNKSPYFGIGIRILRLLNTLSSTILFLPILSLLFQTYKCTDYDEWIISRSIKCYDAGHVAFVVLGVFLIPVFVLVSICMVLMSNFYREVQSMNRNNAMTQGRSDCALLLSKTVVSFIFTLIVTSIPSFLSLCFLCFSAFVYIAVYLHYMPYVNFKLNELKVGFGSGYLLATIAAFVSVIDPTFNPSFLLLLGIPMAGFCGGSICRLRHELILTKSMDAIHSYPELSIWARKRLQTLRNLQLKYGDASAISKTGAKESNSFAAMMNHVQKKAVDEDTDTSGSQENSDGDISVKQRMYIQRNIKRLGDEVELAYRTALDRFSKNGTALLEAASFFRHYHDNHYLELTTLNFAKKSCQTLDIKFAVYERLRSLREGERTESGHHKVTAVDRVLFDQEWKAACNEETKLYKIVYQLWQSLLHPSPDLAQLESYAELFYEALQNADEKYQSCLRINPESPLALRSYSNFLLTGKGHQDEANEYRSKADRLEDVLHQSVSRDVHRFLFDQQVSDLEANDEYSAVITISGDMNSLGEILEANMAACRLFSRPKADLIGNNVNIIVPKPFSWVHDEYLRRFSRSGRSLILNTTRALLGVDGTGAMIPLLMHFKESPAAPEDENAAPRLSAVMVSPKTEEHLILFENSANNHRILHADRKSLSCIFGVAGSDLEQSELSMSDYMPDLRQEEEEIFSDDDYECESPVTRLTQRLPGTNDRGRTNLRLRATSNARSSDGGTGRDRPPTISPGGSPTTLDQPSDLFLKKLVSKSNHSQVLLENTADASLTSIMARIQIVPVADYGTVYLLAWKNPKKKTRSHHKHHHRSGQGSAFNVSLQQKCPVLHQSDSHFNTRAGIQAMKDSSVDSPPTVNTSNLPTGWVSTHEVSMADSQPTVVTSTSHTDRNSASLNEGTPSSYHGKQPNVATNESPKKAKSVDDYGSAYGGTSASKLLQHVITANTSDTNPIVKRLRIVVIGMVVVFVILASVASLSLQEVYDESVLHSESILAGSGRLSSFLSVQLSLFHLHIPNSEFDNVVQERDMLWDRNGEFVEKYDADSRDARSLGEEVGGAAHQKDILRQHEVVDKFNSESTLMSINELRDYTLSLMRDIRTEYSLADLVPGDTVASAVLFFDNMDKIRAAFNASSLKRLDHLQTVTRSYETVLISLSFSVLTAFVVFTAAASWFYFRELGLVKKQVLRVFLVLKVTDVRRLQNLSASILRQHLAKITKSELLDDNDSESESEESSESDGEVSGDFDLGNMAAAEKEADENISSLRKHIFSTFGHDDTLHDNDDQSVTEENLDIQPQKSFASSTRSARYSRSTREGSTHRTYKDSSRFVIHSLLRSIGPLSIFGAWVIYMFISASNVLTSLRQETGRIILIESSVSSWVEYQQYVGMYALRVSFPNTTFGAATEVEAKKLRGDISVARQTSLSKLSTLIDGGPGFDKQRVDEFPRNRDEYDLLTDNVCVLFSGNEKRDCEETNLRNGLQSFALEFINKGFQIVADLPEPATDSVEALTILKDDEDLQSRLKEFHNDLYPLPVIAAEEIAEKSFNSAETLVESTLSRQDIATIVCVLSFVFVSLFFTIPVIQKIGKTLVASFCILVLLPEELITSDRRLRQEVRALSRMVTTSNESSDAALLLATRR